MEGIVQRFLSRLTTRSSQRRGVRTGIVRTPLAWLIVAFVVLAAAGCGGTSKPNTANNTPAPAGTGTDAPARNISVQLWRFYRYGGREPGVADVIDHAEQVVEANCMHRAGFTYWPVVPVVPSGVSLLDDGLSDVPSGVAPPEAAVLRIERRQGYGLYTEFVLRSKTMAAPNANSNYVTSLSPAEQNRYQLAVLGDPRRRYKVRFPGGGVETGPAEGCIAQAAKTMYGSLIRNDLRYNAGNNVQRLVGDRVFAMPTIKPVTKRWARCMQKQSGHVFATPGAVVGWVRSQYGSKDINRQTRELEIRYSTTSTRCTYQSGLASRYAAATWRVLRTMPLSWYRSIVNARNWNARALVKARAILTRSSRS